MFTKLGPIVAPFIRQAESADTHLYIKQHERDQNKRKGGDQHSEDESEFSDEASVSVDALLLFLENMSGKQKQAQESSTAYSTAIKNPKPTSPSLYAAHAYAHAAKTSPHAPDISATTQNDMQIPVNPEAEPLIETLIEQIRELKIMGITELHIERGDTFIGSLFLAIETAKNQSQPI